MKKSPHACGFTLLELLVALSIGLALSAIAWPVLGALLRDTRNTMAASQVTAILEKNTLYAREYKQADAKATEPSVAGAVYLGAAVVFDQAAHKAWFCLNSQRAAPDAGSGGSGPYIELQADPDTNLNGPVNKKAYDRIRNPAVEHMDLSEDQIYYGVAAEQDATGKVTGYTLVGPRAATDPLPSFAACAQVSGAGIPQRRHVYVDLLNSQGHVPVATVLPWVLVVPKDSSAPFDPTHLDAVPGRTDRDKLNALIQQAHGRLVSLAVGGTSKI